MGSGQVLCGSTAHERLHLRLIGLRGPQPVRTTAQAIETAVAELIDSVERNALSRNRLSL